MSNRDTSSWETPAPQNGFSWCVWVITLSKYTQISLFFPNPCIVRHLSETVCFFLFCLLRGVGGGVKCRSKVPKCHLNQHRSKPRFIAMWLLLLPKHWFKIVLCMCLSVHTRTRTHTHHTETPTDQWQNWMKWIILIIFIINGTCQRLEYIRQQTDRQFFEVICEKQEK